MACNSIERRKTKLVFLGDTGVGKSSIIANYMYDHFENKYDTTIGIDFFSKSIIEDDFITRLQIWDTAGQERFRSLIPSYIRDVSIAIVVYDVTNEESFLNVSYWIDCIKKENLLGNELIILLVGNKIDLIKDENNNVEKISKKKGIETAKKFGIQFIETSAKTGKNVSKIFSKSIQLWHEKQNKIFEKKLEKMNINNMKQNISNVDLQDKVNDHDTKTLLLSKWCCFEWLHLI